MLVAVTGGTGFVGSHSAAALVRSGHRVRLLARDPALVKKVLAPLGVPAGAVETAAVDLLDAVAVGRAMRGADAVLHAAAVYSFDSRRRAAMRAVSARGTETVLGAARRAGADPIVHVSSFAALLPSGGVPLHEGSAVGRSREAYAASKAEAEHIARRHQAEGAPVVITYPPALLGPDDPRLGDQTARLRNLLRGLVPIWPTGGFPVGDVRDTAALHATLLGQGGPARSFGPGRYLSTRDYVRTVRAVTGRSLPAGYLPARALLGPGLLADLAQRVLPVDLPLQYGAIHICACAARVSERADRPPGVAARPVTETIADTVGWLHRTGRLTTRQAGAAAFRAPAQTGAPTGGTP